MKAHSRQGLGSLSAPQRWRAAVRENLRLTLDCLVTLIFLGCVVTSLLMYFLLFVLPAKMFLWVRHLGLGRHAVF